MKKVVRSYSFDPDTIKLVEKVAKMWKCSESHAADEMLRAQAERQLKTGGIKNGEA